MQTIYKFLSYFLIFSAIRVKSQTHEYITQNFVESANEILNFLLGNSAGGLEFMDNILSHGCWCSRLDQLANKSILGGSSPVDEIDEICKEWFMTRHCNDNLDGGTCFGLNNIDFTYQLDNSLNCNTNDVNFPTPPLIFYNTCEFDSCMIDTWYIQSVIQHILSPGWVPIPVTDPATCPQGLNAQAEWHCLAFAQFSIKQPGPLPPPTTTQAPPTTTAIPSSVEVAEACEDAEFDLTILIDGSGSVSRANYAIGMQFVQNLIDSLVIGEANTKVTIAQFSRETTTYCVFSNDRTVVNSAINSCANDQDRGTTHTSFAIETMMGHMVTNGRVGVPQVMIVMTDGRASGGLDDDVIDDMHAAGIIAFAIGIGSGADQAELAEIASDPDNEFMYSLENFDDLAGIHPGITQAICNSDGTRSIGGDRGLGDALPSDQIIVTTHPGPVEIEKEYGIDDTLEFIALINAG